MDAISVSKSTKLGTLRWAAPEMFGSDPLDPARHSPAVDIFALGVVIGEVFLCSPPFPSALADQDVVTQIHKKTAPHDYSALRHISVKLEAMIKACCSDDPQMRPNMAAMCYFLWPEVKKDFDKVRFCAIFDWT